MSHTPVPGPCRAFLNDFSAFVDGELDPRRRDEIQAHVDCCQRCLDHLTAYRRGVTVLRSLEDEAPADFWTRLEQRLWLGPELSVIDGGKEEGRPARWSRPAVSLAAAAVLALFVIARGLGPGSGEVRMGPDRIQASVAVTLPTVPEPERDAALASAPETRMERRSAPVRRASEPVQLAYQAEEAALGLLDGGLRQPDDGLARDGWVRPVRLGGDRWDARVSLVRTSALVTPAPWNVDRAVGLP